PPTSYIYDSLSTWYDIINNKTAKMLKWNRKVINNSTRNKSILEAFESADAIIPTLSAELPICSKDILTSKLLNFKNLSKPINSSFISLAKSLNNYNCDETNE
ncbi:17976_t:CDS:2, partial [Gigaspora margarita]